jgi:uncharacterized caspase-like protein
MSSQFDHGYALLIGVDENQVPRWSLPDVAKDVAAVAGVLANQARCAYAPENVKTVTGPDATRAGILDGLRWLKGKVRADPDATAVLYYTGHGWRDEAVQPHGYYLLPCDVEEDALRSSALRAGDFAEAVAALNPRRLLVLLDCCHAGGMEVKGLEAAGYVGAAFPSELLLVGEAAVSATDGAKGLDRLAQGAGRAVLSSSQGHQPSYLRRDRAMSIFTYHVVEALTGHAQPAWGATEVLASDIMGHVWRTVPASARRDWGADQQPDYRVSGNFPIAMLLGGKGLGAGVAPPDPLAAASAPSVTQTMGGSGVQVGRDQTVHGDLIIGGSKTEVNTGGGAYVNGNVDTHGGDFVGRDRKGSVL